MSQQAMALNEVVTELNKIIFGGSVDHQADISLKRPPADKDDKTNKLSKISIPKLKKPTPAPAPRKVAKSAAEAIPFEDDAAPVGTIKGF